MAVEVWLSNCAIGVLMEFTDVGSVIKRLRSRGFSFSSKYLGDKSVLWCFESEIEMEGFINDMFFWDDMFSTMSRWSNSFTPKSRLSWIKVGGVPLSCWDTSFFMKLGGLVGEPFLVEEKTSLRCRLDRGRFLAMVQCNKVGPHNIKVQMELESFFVKIEEDLSPVSVIWITKVLGLQEEGKTLSSGIRKKDKDEEEVKHSYFKLGGKKTAVLTHDKSNNDKGKGAWIRKAKVKVVHVPNKHAKLIIDERQRCRSGYFSYRSLSTSSLGFDQILSNLKLIKGECSSKQKKREGRQVKLSGSGKSSGLGNSLAKPITDKGDEHEGHSLVSLDESCEALPNIQIELEEGENPSPVQKVYSFPLSKPSLQLQVVLEGPYKEDNLRPCETIIPRDIGLVV
ncbi:hypothetical protein Dsin_012630 [Dipteronia sinensis]|uniref:DUF4283 domain-containing protein n=1 Tax=Dipteronia sinensis TaxID=43782 RepID=A0AAE0AJ66_9ROSI|nr:hypothetical protein Dsin_012630 [Dipteronia sinensis]